eukprot:Phypoly_transcript_13909.p1 GENE.Phypoly_transcript_13909~~Phypoly_transcript_13909.p1  ORF type:complete len:299 (+),score=55.31 Phypoly_transcript_13909:71-967(+)
MPQMKVLITGASGLLGRAMMRAFADCEVLGLGLTRADPAQRIVACDLLDAGALQKVVEDFQPFVIIHCAAERRPDICANKPDVARVLNVEVTERIAKIAQVLDCWLLYISTDYVFDGKNPPYFPNSDPNPLSIYGKTKLEGEQVIAKTLMNAGILRVPLLYGPVDNLDECGVTVLLKNILDGKPMEIDNWQIRYPTHVDDVAAACRKLCERKTKFCGFGGTWHFSAEEAFTKYTIVKLLGEVISRDTSHITGNTNPPSGDPRPHDCKLDTTAMQLMGFVKLRNFRESLPPILQPWVNK